MGRISRKLKKRLKSDIIVDSSKTKPKEITIKRDNTDFRRKYLATLK